MLLDQVLRDERSWSRQVRRLRRVAAELTWDRRGSLCWWGLLLLVRLVLRYALRRHVVEGCGPGRRSAIAHVINSCGRYCSIDLCCFHRRTRVNRAVRWEQGRIWRWSSLQWGSSGRDPTLARALVEGVQWRRCALLLL